MHGVYHSESCRRKARLLSRGRQEEFAALSDFYSLKIRCKILFLNSVLKLKIEEKGWREAMITVFNGRSSCCGVGVLWGLRGGVIGFR